ncbi:MAG: class I SAM-dependent methyltransferase [Deltaproteobacteria bacterium]|uniref:class I SAM-dependent methyltransferase n=1 Tax=Desulfobacula sp. TaxID=2593537 RepID=UPI0019CD807C|nr:class I SAM-dependent methyltransferase [Candidatus Desulfobacula maris]MBL6993226.1 class I SAM-dependent methyltransferase [Desulfobacula sp.]
MESHVKDHYNSDNLTQNIKTALIKAGKDLSNLELKDLSPIDQIHTGGARSSIELFKKLTISPDAQVLDAGCGIGGSSRLLAKQFNCRVVGVDLAEKFIESAIFLTQCTQLENLVSFQQGSVLDLPFENNTFDAILCQHILMNIEDKSTAVKEFFRVLKPDGKLMLHEIEKGDNDSLLLPVPWADKSSISFLESRDVMSHIFKEHGFEVEFFSDQTSSACTGWEKFNAVSKKRPPQPNALGLGIIFGSNAKFFGENMYANFKNNSICLVEVILKKL